MPRRSSPARPPNALDGLLKPADSRPFYNASPLRLEDVVADPDTAEQSLRAYQSIGGAEKTVLPFWSFVLRADASRQPSCRGGCCPHRPPPARKG